MNPNTGLPREAEAPETTPNPVEKLLSNRPLVYGVLGIVAVILIAYIAMGMMERMKERNADRAWASVHRGMSQLRQIAIEQGVFYPEGSPEYFQALDADVQIRVFNDVLQSVRGTVAEPAVLYYLGNAYLVGRQLDAADRTFRELEEKYPNHYFTDPEASYVSQTLVQAAKRAVERERQFFEENPDFLTGRSSEESPPSEGSAPVDETDEADEAEED